MAQQQLDLEDRQLVCSLTTGDTGRLDEVRGNVAFVYFESEGLLMCALECIKPVDDLFIWSRYFESK